MKKKRYPTYRKKRKRKRQPVKNMITAVVLCITIALCNGWVPPHTLEDAKKQGELFGTVFLTYIEENAKNFSENISETDRRTGEGNFFGKYSGIQRQSLYRS